MLIAIDGPVAAGKSTVGRQIAKILGIPFLDTGLMYRALTWQILKKNIDPSDEKEIKKLINANTHIKVKYSGQHDNIKLEINGKELDEELRSPEVEKAVSLVSRISVVRKFLVSQQQRVARSFPDIVMAGRDIGTVVLPEAKHKFFLIASSETRAQRRLEELIAKGESPENNSLRGRVEERDELDTKRAISPLKPAADAIILDTDNLSVEQVTERILASINAR